MLLGLTENDPGRCQPRSMGSPWLKWGGSVWNSSPLCGFNVFLLLKQGEKTKMVVLKREWLDLGSRNRQDVLSARRGSLMDMIFFLFPHSPSLLLITAHCVQGREPPHPISKVHERLQAQRCDPGLSMRTQYPPAQGLVQDEDMTQVNQSSSIIQSGDFCLGFKRDVRFHFSP